MKESKPRSLDPAEVEEMFAFKEFLGPYIIYMKEDGRVAIFKDRTLWIPDVGPAYWLMPKLTIEVAP